MRRLALVLTALSLAATACTGGIDEAAEVLSRPGSPSVSPSSASPTAAASPPAAAIVVRTPRDDDDLRSPIVVSGTAISASGEVLVRVLDAGGMELAAMRADVDCGASCRGSFRAPLAFFSPVRQEGTIQVFEVGPGGSADHLVEVGVTLVPGV